MEKAIEILLNGKTDSELLESLVLALTNKDDFALKDWAEYSKKSTLDGANIEIVRHICYKILARSHSEGNTENTSNE